MELMKGRLEIDGDFIEFEMMCSEQILPDVSAVHLVPMFITVNEELLQRLEVVYD